MNNYGIYPSINNCACYEIKDIRETTREIILHYLNCCSRMFEYNGLPDSIPQRALELLNLTQGFSIWVEVGGNVYALQGGLGGKPDPYFMPTEAIIANPALQSQLKQSYKIDSDCVVMPSDSTYRGVLHIIRRYARLLAENQLTLYMNSITARAPIVMSASDDSSIESAKQFLKKIETGERGIIAERPFLEGIKSIQLTGPTEGLTSLIELQQYLKAGLNNDLGLDSTYNMKRESITSGEVDKDTDFLRSFPDDMLYNRKQALDKINKMFNLNISVKLSSSWREEVDNENLADSTADEWGRLVSQYERYKAN